MQLKRLHLTHFKNHTDKSFNFEQDLVAFCGKNGTGKTNVLDAIYLLCMCRSLFSTSESNNIQHEAPFYSVYGQININEKKHEVACMVQKGSGKTFKWDKEDYSRLSDHIGKMPVVVIAPGDIALINEGSEGRRKWMDMLLAQTDRTYLIALSRYQKLLEQRNKLLKIALERAYLDKMLLDTLDRQMLEPAKTLYEGRRNFIQHFIPLFIQHHNNLTREEENPGLVYLSDLHETAFEELLSGNREQDMAIGRTEKGLHKDDLLLDLDGFPIKKFGSQGQIKSFLIAMKLAQFDFLKDKTGLKPFLLLDDIFEKLDEYRAERLMQMVANDHFGQIFITDTHRQRIEAIFGEIGKNPQVEEMNNERMNNE